MQCRRLFTEWLELFCSSHELPTSRTAILPDKSVQNCAGSSAVVNPNCVNPRRKKILFDQEAVGKEELKKEELGTKGEGNDEVI